MSFLFMAKRGRPTKPEAELLSEKIIFMLLPDEKAAYSEAARDAGFTLSQWIRTTLNRAAATARQRGASGK